MNKRWLTIAIILLLAANAATLVLLWSRNGRQDAANNRPGGGQAFEYVVNELKLDKQQQDAYARLRDEHQAGQRALRDSIRLVKDAFFALLKDSAAPDSLIDSYSRKAADMEQRVELVTFRHFQKVRAICTPQQQQQFDKIIQDVLRRMARPGPPQGRGGQHPPHDMPPPPGNGEGPPPGN